MPPLAPDAAASLQLVRRSTLCQRVRAALAPFCTSTDTGSPSQLIAACSGGPDSTALVVLLWALQTEGGLAVHVVCVDHQLRAQSALEAAQVCAAAARLGLSAERVAVVCPPGASKMATARTVRYAALAQVALRRGARAVLVAHTQEDQTETMLMRWLGGAGLLGLCGMEAQRELPVPDCPAGRVTLLRPLLTTRRAELEELLQQTAGLVAPLPIYDPSNADRHYQRPRLRHELLPLLRQEQPQLDSRLAQLSAQLRADAEYLEQQAAVAYAALRRQADEAAAPSGAGICLPLAETAALPPALFARVMRRASGGGLGQPHITALAALCTSEAGTQSLDLPGGWRAERRYTELRFFRPEVPQNRFPSNTAELWIPACGQYSFAQGTLCLEWESVSAESASHASTAVSSGRRGSSAAIVPLHRQVRRKDEVLLVLTKEAFPLLVRAPRPGDRIRLRPSGGHRKISDLLIDLKVPRPARADILLLCHGEQILWVIGHRQAASPALPPALVWRDLPTPPAAEQPPAATTPTPSITLAATEAAATDRVLLRVRFRPAS